MVTYFTITGFIMLFWLAIVFIASRLKKPPKVNIPKAKVNPDAEKMAILRIAMDNICVEEINPNTISDGYGEFGYDVTNPIPTNTVFGSKYYLQQLRTLDNKKIIYNRTGSITMPNIDRPIDRYEIFNGTEKIAVIYICPYFKKNSERPPTGFKLSPL